MTFPRTWSACLNYMTHELLLWMNEQTSTNYIECQITVLVLVVVAVGSETRKSPRRLALEEMRIWSEIKPIPFGIVMLC